MDATQLSRGQTASDSQPLPARFHPVLPSLLPWVPPPTTAHHSRPSLPAGHPDPCGATLCHQPHSAPGTRDCELPDPPASPAERPERHTRAQQGLWDMLTGRMVDWKWCSPRKSSKENLSLSQIWNTTRAGILLSVLSSLQKASWPRGEAEKEVGEQD